MSATIAVGSPGKHSSPYVELGQRARRAEADNRQLVAAVEDREREIYEALLRGCQDAMLIAQLRAEKAVVLAANEELRRETVKAKADTLRAQAEQERLRQSVINARPKITVAVQPLDRPYVSAVQIPYPVPVGQSTANDETQQLPILDQPEAAWPAYNMHGQGVA